MSNELLSKAYLEVDPLKAQRLKECATELSFIPQDNGRMKLETANFCRVRLCPMCGWRRGLKVFAHTKSIMDGINSERQLSYILVTLTCKNVPGEELGATIDSFMIAWDRMIKCKRVKQAIKGFYRGMEITHNIDFKSKDYDTFHPHFHCVFAVNPSYFTSRDYITQHEWTSLWKRSMRLDYTPIVDVRRIKGSTAEAVSEVAKYAVKSADYIIPEDWDLTIDTVRLLDKVLNKRRFVAYGGIFKEWHKKLNLDDEQDGDLVCFDSAHETKATVSKVWYSWSTGYNQYIKK